jgi:hypothetical protein
MTVLRLFIYLCLLSGIFEWRKHYSTKGLVPD